ncbi:MAG: ATP-binding cassette domain-containing protein [bacterium]
MLQIDNLTVEVRGKEILHNISLTIESGKTYILFGPNGSGKTTLLMTLMGLKNYRIVEGAIIFDGVDITHLPVNERVNLGIGIMFQRPPTIRGLKTREMIALCDKGKSNIEEMAHSLNLTNFLDRSINDGFSGGEIKRSELLQLIAQGPKLALLDEPESGVDLENIALIGKAINKLLQKDMKNLHDSDLPPAEIKKKRKNSGLIISHTGHILKYVDADFGYVLLNGKLDCVGNPREILKCVSEIGYEDCVKCLI